MTPKEKATKMIHKFFDEITNHMTWDEAKLCADVCIDELIYEAGQYGMTGTTSVKYYKKVKEEIENL